MNDNLSFAKRFNSIYIAKSTTEDIKKQIKPENMEDIKHAFPLMEPYVQASILQSVIYLTEEQFENIKYDYKELIELGRTSSDGWVIQLSSLFQDYPNFNSIEGSSKIDFNSLSPILLENQYGIGLIGPESNPFRNKNYCIISVKPPSERFPTPAPEGPRYQSDIPDDHFISAPSKDKQATVTNSPQKPPPIQRPQAVVPQQVTPLKNPPSQPKKKKIAQNINDFNRSPNACKIQKTLDELFGQNE